MENTTRNTCPSSVRAERIRTALQVACWAAALALLGFTVGARAVCWPHDLPAFANARFACVLLAFGFLLTNALIAKLPVRAGLVALASLISITGVSLLCHFASIEPISHWVLVLQEGPVDKPKKRRSTWRNPKRIGIYQFHPRYGYSHVSDSQGQHETSEFNVTYTIDAEGCRVTPVPDAPQGQILITGGSFTFGHGVEDSECFPSQLASEHWPVHHVRNHGVSGYGTSHAYLVVSDALSHGSELPALVIYAMIPDHIRRNYLRESWVSHVTGHIFFNAGNSDTIRDRRGHPHFELVNGELVYHGLIYSKEAVPDASCLCYTELMLTKAFLREMNRKCSERGVPFVVVVLPELASSDHALHNILETLNSEEISYLDLSGMPLKTIIGDGHPNGDAHASFAEAIAASFISDMRSISGGVR